MQAATWRPVLECFPSLCRLTIPQSGPPLYLTVDGGRFVGRIGQIGLCTGGGSASDVETYELAVIAQHHGRATRLEGHYRHRRLSDTCPAEANWDVMLAAR